MCTDGPASRGFSLARLLVLTKSYAWLVCRMVGLLPTTRPQLRDRLAGCCTDQQQATMKMTMKAISHFEINYTSLP